MGFWDTQEALNKKERYQQTMFTGIVEEMGRVARINYSPIFQITIQAKKVSENLCVSDSICINGVCLTIIQKEKDTFSVQVMPQTLEKTNLGQIKVGDKVNLERALLPTSFIGGHFVTGDIDGLAVLEKIEPGTSQWNFTLRCPSQLMKYIVNQGRVALEGVSLTVAEKKGDTFKVSLIPYTLTHTNLKFRKEKDRLNLEVDILAKYVEQIIQDRKEKKREVNFFRLNQFMGVIGKVF